MSAALKVLELVVSLLCREVCVCVRDDKTKHSSIMRQVYKSH